MKRLIPILLLLFAGNVFAGNAELGSLSKIHFMSDGVIIVYTNGTRSGAPTCATHTSRFAIDGTTEGGKVQVSGILTMYASGKSIKIYGANNCNAYGDTETISYFRTDD